MGEPKHTPGPWYACGCGKCGQVWSEETELLVATVGRGDTFTPSHDEARANARLIAAAPKLLAAATHVLAKLDSETATVTTFDADRLRAAIADATSASIEQHSSPPPSQTTGETSANFNEKRS